MARFDVEITEHSGAGGAIALILILAIAVNCCGDSGKSKSHSDESAAYNNEYIEEYDSEYVDGSYSSEYGDELSVGNGGESQITDEEFNEQRPKPLIDCYQITQNYSGRVGTGDAEDSFGHVHYGVLKMNCYGAESYNIASVTYALERQYTTMSCSFIHGRNIYDASSQVEIYLDDTLVYTSPTISLTSEAVSAVIDITGANTVRIDVVGVDFAPVSTKVNQTIIEASVY